MITILNNLGGIGDKIIYLSFPENYFKNTGKKLLSPEKKEWYFKYNPYVEHGESENILRLYNISTNYEEEIIQSVAHRVIKNSNIHIGEKKIFLRHPRLYIHEDVKKENYITIHCTGVTCGGSIPDNILEQIKHKYSNFRIIQIGGTNDKKINFAEDFRGLSIFDTAELISKSIVFIGPNSGMMNLSFCYPSTSKKIILLNKNEKQIEYFYPFKKNTDDSNWLDFHYTLYNCYDSDIGTTFSYKKI